MKVRLIAVGGKMPGWVTQGYDEYAKRLPADLTLELVELTLGHRGKGADIARAKRQEGDQMLAAIPKGDLVVALEVEGRNWSTEQLASNMEGWRMGGRNVSLLIGGPDGLDARCSAAAEQRWSLSALTLPHPLVRVLLAEQLYRACTILQGHPYHK
ncbi:23S rRNA (pseudouridine(1915)-N(3))-methyltransferase RlmH [Marinobacterium sedimentorum]|jgi:23S rRNA (pseudouridine1915-N3)-methyltransferase|uniref:23S rRNA (pseudouridine(1915)-N(3))-methyltransferase RlmH n=1 Tax=Marinobacterium sedimentorum TaxID=2927804 RepID=UPI0020C737A5|nr:23S rRNA (pseudouridine(1915)-N(3))-methyltransferase RlmH [Marinobacterium sedimentorum]MCP8686014.1 23S rRNA (pseudouridine(1915)-N(3))-methyltransferase RlmH [Marinobacterium sedimentorum]